MKIRTEKEIDIKRRKNLMKMVRREKKSIERREK